MNPDTRPGGEQICMSVVLDDVAGLVERMKEDEDLQALLEPGHEFASTMADALVLVNAAENQLRSEDDTGLLLTFKKLSELHFEHIETVTFDAFWSPEHKLRKAIRDTLQILLRHPVLEEKFSWNSGDEGWAAAGIPCVQFGFVQEKKSKKRRK